jgi:hypothetical protein
MARPPEPPRSRGESESRRQVPREAERARRAQLGDEGVSAAAEVGLIRVHAREALGAAFVATGAPADVTTNAVS